MVLLERDEITAVCLFGACIWIRNVSSKSTDSSDNPYLSVLILLSHLSYTTFISKWYELQEKCSHFGILEKYV